MCNGEDENSRITTRQFLILLKENLKTEGTYEDFLFFGRKRGWLEESDQNNAEKPIQKMAVARIVHQLLRIELGEKEEEHWEAAMKLKDLFDCHTCVNHIAQVTVKGIILPRVISSSGKETEYLFGAGDFVTVREAKEILLRVFDETKRGSAFGEPILRKKARPWNLSEYPEHLIDVRTKEEFESFHPEGACHIPMAKILNHPESVAIGKEETLVLYCDQGYQSEIAANCLLDAGYQNVFFAKTSDFVISTPICSDVET